MPIEFEFKPGALKSALAKRNLKSKSTADRNVLELLKAKVQSGTGGSNTHELFSKKNSQSKESGISKAKVKLQGFLSKKGSLVPTPGETKVQNLSNKNRRESMLVFLQSNHFSMSKDL